MAHRVLLVFPPHTRSSEPPLGVGLVASFLQGAGVPCRILDLNARAAPALALGPGRGSGARFLRGKRHAGRALRELRTPRGYASVARYQSWMEFYAAALASSVEGGPWVLTPADFRDRRLEGFGPAHAAWAWECSHPWEGALGDLEAAVVEFDPTLVGISITYRSQFLPALAVGSALQRWGLPVVWGGPFLDSLPQETIGWLQTRGAVVRGAGEPGLASLLGLEARLAWVPSMDETALDMALAPVRVVPFTTSRGCHWGRCAFCPEARLTFVQHPGWEPDLDLIHARWPEAVVHFTDNALPPPVLLRLAQRRAGPPWWGFVRPHPLLADEDFARELAASGCLMLQLGFESASPRVLEAMGKGTDPSLFPRIIRSLRRAGIKSYAYLMFGFPGETDEEREATLALCASAPPDFLNVSLCRVPPGSPLAQKGQAPPDSCYRTLPDHHVRFPQARAWVSRRFAGHPAIRPLIARTPRYYKSSHAPFLSP